MSDNKRITKISKYLSLHLRHQPDRIGLVLGPGGWVSIDELLDASSRDRFSFSREELNEVVASSDKQRFAIDATGTRIRANQGHSVQVDLGLEPVDPPDVLYHGTGAQTGDLIERDGLLKMSRQHVHLSPDVETATKVGMRHGKPIIYVVDAGAMHRAGHLFYRSENGVWLIDNVPREYLRRL